MHPQASVSHSAAFGLGSKVVIKGKSQFAGLTAVVTGQGKSGITPMVKVDVTNRGQKFESVPFLPSELEEIQPSNTRSFVKQQFPAVLAARNAFCKDCGAEYGNTKRTYCPRCDTHTVDAWPFRFDEDQL